MHSLNPKGTASTLLDHWRLNDFHLAPLNVQKLKWEDFIRDQLMQQEIASIREKIVNTAIVNMIQRYCLEKKLFEFGSQCVQLAWLRLFDWLSLRVDPYWKCNCSGRPLYLIVDREPKSGPADTWISGNVSRIFVQRSASLRSYDSLFPGTTASNTKFSDHKKNNFLEKQRIKLKSSKVGETKQTDKTKKKVVTPIITAITMTTTMTTRNASVTKVSTQSTKSFKTHRQAKNCLSSAEQEYTKNVSTTNTNDEWRNLVGKNLKKHGFSSSGDKNQKHLIIMRPSKKKCNAK